MRALLRSGVLLLLLGSVWTSTARGNDSMVAIGAGGIVLEKSDTVRMASEDLYISLHEVKVDYVFENVTDQPVTATIGFPLPVYEHEDYDFDVQGVDLGAPWSPFTTLIDGRAQPSIPRMTVRTSEGVDISSILSDLDMLPTSYADLPNAASIANVQTLLDEAARAAGFSDRISDSWHSWRYELTYVWELELAAKARVSVEHQYSPVSGGFPLAPLAATSGQSYREIVGAEYCPDDAQWQAIVAATEGHEDGLAGYILDVGYVLKTGANWATPIGDFHLTVETGAPTELPVLCWDGPLTRATPTTWVYSARNFVPDTDLLIGFFQPRPN